MVTEVHPDPAEEESGAPLPPAVTSETMDGETAASRNSSTGGNDTDDTAAGETESSDESAAEALFEEMLEDAREAILESRYEEALEALRKARGTRGRERSREALDLWNTAGSHMRKAELRGAWCELSLTGEGSPLKALAFSPDGGKLISGSENGVIRLRERATGNHLCTFEAPEAPSSAITSIAYSKDGRQVLSGHADSTVRLWDSETKAPVRDMTGHTGMVSALAFIPGKGRAVSAGHDNLIKLWDLTWGHCLTTFEGHEAPVTALALSPDELWVLSGSMDGTLILWEARTGHKTMVLKNSDEAITSVALAPDGKRALAGNTGHTVKLWDLRKGEELCTLEEHQDTVTGLVFAGCGTWALSGSLDSVVKIWNLEKGECSHTLEGHRAPVRALALSPDGRWAASGDDSESLLLWELDWDYEADKKSQSAEESDDDREELWKPLQETHDMGNLTVKLTVESLSAPDGSGLTATICHRIKQVTIPEITILPAKTASRSPAARGHVYAGQERKGCRKGLKTLYLERAIEGHTHAVKALAMSECGRWALSGSQSGELRLWNLRQGKLLRELEGHSGAITSTAISADGRRGISSSLDKTVKVWDLSTGKCLHALSGGDETVTSVAFSPDGRWAVSGETNSIIRIWDVEKGTLLHLKAALDTVRAVCFCADGRGVVASNRSEILIWDITESEKNLIGRYSGQIKVVNTIALSPDRKWLVAGGDDGTLNLWEILPSQEKAMNPQRTMAGHGSSVTSVVMTGDGRWAFSAGTNKVIKAWQLARGECVFTSDEQADEINSLALSANAQWLLSGTSDGRLKIWELDWEWESRVASVWEDGACPLVENFLYLHTPPAAALPGDAELSQEEKQEALRRRGKATWTEDDVAELKLKLENAGYGFLTLGGIKDMLREMAPILQKSLKPPPRKVGESYELPAQGGNITEAGEQPAPGGRGEEDKEEKKSWLSRLTNMFKK